MKLKDGWKTCRKLFSIYNFYNAFRKLKKSITQQKQVRDIRKNTRKRKSKQLWNTWLGTPLTHNKRNANKHHNKYHLSPIRLAKSKHFTTHVSLGVRKLVCFWWECELGQLLLITSWQYLYKLLKQIPFSSAITPLRMYLTTICAHLWDNIPTKLFSKALSIKTKE